MNTPQIQPKDTYLEAALRRMEEASDSQIGVLKKQLAATRFCALMLCLMVVMMGVVLLPLRELTGQAENTLAQIDAAASQITQADIPATVDSANGLIEELRTGLLESMGQLQQAASVIQTLNVEGLNTAIADFQKAASALARLFNGG